jgi:xylulokinase
MCTNPPRVASAREVNPSDKIVPALYAERKCGREAAMAEADKATFLGLDVGTSSVKALLIDLRQRTIAEASAPLSVSRPRALWSEQNPNDWVEGVESAVSALRRRAPGEFAHLVGVGLSGQMHGATLLDAENKPLRPAILWNDGRSFAECVELKRRVPDVEKRTGNLVMPGFTAPKMLWVEKHEPDIARATRRVLLPKDYVRLRLSGEAASEMSDASGTSWLDVGKRRWDETLLEATGLTLAAMPRLVEGSEVSAYLSPSVARAWGVEGRKVPIAGGGGDNAASAIGVGATAPGEGFVSLGTSGVVFSVTDRFVSLPERTLHAFCHSLPQRWHGMAVMLSAASALAWIASVLGRETEVRALAAAAEAFARSKETVHDAPIFLPYLSGERTPYNDAEASGMFAGLRAGHKQDALVFAVMEGVALSFADGVDVLDAAGARPGRPLLVGGGARSEFWGQMIADATGLTIDLALGAEAGAALGAARLGMLAAGAGSVETVCVRPPTERAFHPDPTRAVLHAPRLQRYRALYQAEKEARLKAPLVGAPPQA